MIKRLIKCIKQYKTSSILSPIFMVLEVVMEVIIPLLMASLIDKGIDAHNMNYILKMGFVLLAFALIALVFGVLSASASSIAASGLASNIRSELYHNIQEFSFSNIDKYSTSSIITRITTDVTNVRNAYQMLIRQAVRAPIMLILCLVMSFTINVKISLIFLGAIPILGFGLFFIVWKVHPIFVKVFKKYDNLNMVVGENLRAMRVVKSFVREDYEIKKFESISQEIYKDFTKAEKRLAWNMPLMQFCSYACILLIAWIGAKLIVGRTMTTGQLMSVIGYAMQILMSLMLLSMVLVMIIIAKASAERIVEVLNEKSDIVSKENATTLVKDGSIEFRGVNFSYVKDKNKLCLVNANLKIEEGQTIGIVGATGSGKTTLVNLIPRLYDVTEGSILVGGLDVRDYELNALRAQVAVVLQKNVLFSGTIKENLAWGDENATLDEMKLACKIACADSFIESFPLGYDTYIQQGGSNVSGGQKQRLCLARALLKKPKILILDDSTSAVDTNTDATIRANLLHYLPKMTKIIIAQRLSSIESADKIIVMDDANILDIGSHFELLSRSNIYKEVYDSQSRGDFDE
jgi:ATP-binding cassette subfamily B protein